MKYREIKRIRHKADVKVKDSSNANVTIIQSIARYGFLCVSALISMIAIDGSSPLIITAYQSLSLISISFVTYFNAMSTISYWTGLTGDELVRYKHGIIIQMILNGIIRYGYCAIWGLTTLIPFSIVAWLIGSDSIIDGTNDIGVIILALVIVLWLFVIIWLVNLFYGYTNLETLKYGYSAGESRKASRHFVANHFKDCFKLKLSFIGWNLLGVITLGLIGIYINRRRDAAYDIYFRKVAE